MFERKNIYWPDRFVILKIEAPEETLYKVMGFWSGSYLEGDSWRINSGIESYKIEDGRVRFFGYSGSCYDCSVDSFGATGYGMSVLQDMIYSATVADIECNVINLEQFVEEFKV